MKKYWPETVLALALAVVVLAAWLWQSQALGGGRLTAADVDRYAAAIEANLDVPAEERAVLVERVRAWASEDDGRPVYMLNVMRYHEQVRSHPRLDPAHTATPEASNAHYEAQVIPMALHSGAYPVFAGTVSGADLTGSTLDRPDRIILMRYPNRRAFLELVSDPDYGRVAPYKLMALQLGLTPTTAEIAPPTAALLVLGIALVVLSAGLLVINRRREAASPR